MTPTVSPKFEPIREAIDNLVAVMNEAMFGLLAKANSEREELLNIYQRMEQTAADTHELANLSDYAASQLDAVGDLSDDLATKLVHTICGGVAETPTCPYEDFVEFCDECGHSITTSEKYTHDNAGWYLCESCAAKDEEPIEELAESVGETETVDA